MSCKDCNKMEEEKKVTYYRWDNANIGIFVCEKHAKKVLLALDEGQRGQSDFIQKLTEIGYLLEKIYKKHPRYVSFVLKFSTDKDTDEGELKYNLYTPTLNHNNFDTFELFTEFLKRVADGKDTSIRRLHLLDAIENAEATRRNVNELIETATKELEELEEHCESKS